MRRVIAGALLAGIVCSSARATDLALTVVGGGSLAGYAARDANLELGGSLGLAMDAVGNLYLSDSRHHQVLKADVATGVLDLVAGDGTETYSGDGLPATAAGFDTPGALAFDAAGNLYVVDRGNFVVRRIDALSGIVSTVAGNGNRTGDPAPGGGFWGLGDGGPATGATFSDEMGGLAVDAAGNVVVVDGGNQCVRRFAVGGTIATIAGVPGSNGFSGDGVVGGAAAAELADPTGVVIATSGDIYIADSGNRRVRRVDAANTIETVAGSGGGTAGFSGDGFAATNAELGSLGGLAFDAAGNLLISCVRSGCVRKVDVSAPAPIIVTIAGRGDATLGDGGPATAATLRNPRDVLVDAAGNVFVYESSGDRVRRIDVATGFIDTIAGTGLTGFIGDRGPQQDGVLVAPRGAAYDDASGDLYVADGGDNAIRRIGADGVVTTVAGNGQGDYAGDGGPAFLAILDRPQDVAVSGGLLLIADTGNNLVRAIDLVMGVITTYAQVDGPRALLVASGGEVFVSHDDRIDVIDTNGAVSLYVAGLDVPNGMAMTAAGELYVANTGGNQIVRVSPGLPPTITVVAGTGTAGFGGDGAQATLAQLDSPLGVALAQDEATLVITDTDNDRVRAVDLASGVITTIMGTGVPGLGGDGDLAAAALVNQPGLITATAGGLLFADMGNNRVRRIVSAIDLDPASVSLRAKLSFAVDKKTGEQASGKDSVVLKAKLPLPAGITAANLRIVTNVVDLRQQVALDEKGKQPKAAKPGKTPPPGPFGIALPPAPEGPKSKFKLGLKGTSVDGAKPTSFSFASKGTFRDLLGRAGLTDVTTPKGGTSLGMRVSVTLGDTTFSAPVTVEYKAKQGKSGAAKSVKP